MKSIWLLLIATLFFVFIGCDLDDDDGVDEELPAITTAGLNTFGCLINGQVYVPKKGSFCLDCANTPKLQLTYGEIFEGYRFALGTHNDIDGDVAMTLELFNGVAPLTEGLYSLSQTILEGNDIPISNASCWIRKKISGQKIESEFYSNENIGGVLEIIKIDEENKYISGTFYFSAVDGNGQFVTITDGRFDVTYKSF
ncbi:hypothetical protein [Maribacter hydrothermalis]|uniref:Lipoprotein n=1 Tax=Maribacter hydrothermalis TaxID=1836467 RepID=A0A1B7Z117_9FLAO|nr:hypothetical protein [Maribacter hydrothermalis]APQ18067.1 hypothetical protein BTR34_12340 [Maribacter hydrothermalis]OBR36412.1 hypothetical protein A9200_08230 [Maribacter hydrothermalis]